MARTTTKRTGLAGRLGKVQADAERALSRGYEATLDILPLGPRKAVKRLANQIEATADELSKRRKQALKTVTKQGKVLTGRLEDAVRTFERSRDRALATAERRGTKLVSTIERRVVQAVRPFVRRLEIVTVRDLDQLTRRLVQLERKLSGSRRSAA